MIMTSGTGGCTGLTSILKYPNYNTLQARYWTYGVGVLITSPQILRGRRLFSTFLLVIRMNYKALDYTQTNQYAT